MKRENSKLPGFSQVSKLRDYLLAGHRCAGLPQTPGLPSVADAGGAGIFLPLLAVLCNRKKRKYSIQVNRWCPHGVENTRK